MYQGPATGLFTSPNPFSAAPAGSLAKANNVRYTAPTVISPRPGFELSASFGSAASLADALAFYGQQLLIAYDLTKVAWSATIGGSFTNFTDTLEPVGANRLRFEAAARCLYFNALTGVRVWDGTGVAGEPVFAGNAQGLNLRAEPVGNGWMPPDTAVAYRFTICSKDAFGRVTEGPPSGRAIARNYIWEGAGATLSRLTNVVSAAPGGASFNLPPFGNWQVGDVVELQPGEVGPPAFAAGNKTVTVAVDPGTGIFKWAEAGANGNASNPYTIRSSRNVEVTCELPTKAGRVQCSTNNFIRVYRSDETESATDVPSDELFLCYESAYLTSGEISAGQLVFTDTAPSSTLEVPLYTNPNSDGALSANFQPPQCLDLAYFANRMWFANTAGKQTLELQLIGVGSPDGIQIGDTITFEQTLGGFNFVLTAADATASGNEFEVISYGDPAFNIEETARNLVDCLNNSADNDVFYAYYISSEVGTPGRILLTYAAFDTDGPFLVYSDRATAWNPQLPDFSSPDFLVESSTNAHPARIYYSKLGQPEAVPLTNCVDVDADNDALLRVFPFNFRLLAAKTDGFYFVTNTEPFTVQKFCSYELIAPDSMALLDQRVFCLTDQGVIAISDGGEVSVSLPIDDLLTALGTEATLEDLKERAVGVAYRTARQYILWLIDKDEDGNFTDDNAQALVYSTLSGGWTRYVFGARAAGVDPISDVLYVAPTDDNQLWKENKTGTDADFFDFSLDMGNPAGVNGNELTFAAAVVAQVQAGDVVTAGGANYLVTAAEGTTITTEGETGWTTGTNVTLKRAIECELKFNPFTGGQPAVTKISNQVSYVFRRNTVRAPVATFGTELAPEPAGDAEPITMTTLGWGDFEWGGGAPWGNPPITLLRVDPLAPEVAECCQLSVGFTTRQALAGFDFLGVDARQREDTEVNRT